MPSSRIALALSIAARSWSGGWAMAYGTAEACDERGPAQTVTANAVAKQERIISQ